MSFINAGIKEVYFAKGNVTIKDGKIHYGQAGSTSIANTIFGLGIRQAGSFVGEPLNEIRDKDNRAFPNLFNFKADFSTMQLDLARLASLIEMCQDDSVAVAILTKGITKSFDFVVPAATTGGIFVFDTPASGTNEGLGLDFELSISQTDRIMKVIFERAFGVDDAASLITAADTSDNKIPFLASTTPQIIEADVMSGFISPSFTAQLPSDIAAAYADDANLAEFSINLKTKSTKNAFNKSIVNGFEVELTSTVSGPNVPALIQGANVTFPGDISLVLRSGETITLKTLGLTAMHSFDLGDENRTLKSTLSGTYDIDFVATTGVFPAISNITFNTFLQ